MDFPSERNRAANKDDPLLIIRMITYFFDGNQGVFLLHQGNVKVGNNLLILDGYGSLKIRNPK